MPAPARTARSQQHTAGLRDERVALRDANVAFFQFVAVVAELGVHRGQFQRRDCGFGELARVRGDALPAVGIAQLAQCAGQGGLAFQQVKIRT